MRTPRSSASRAVRSMVASSPAWPPQAILADVMYCMRAASCAASSSSPMSQFRSIIMLHQRIQPSLLVAQQLNGVFHGDLFEAHVIARAQLTQAPEVRRDYVGRFGISAGSLVLHEQHDRLPVGRHLDGPQRHTFGNHVAAGTGDGG